MLDIFLLKTLKILQKVKKDLTTQLNESFHALKAKFASKDLLWLDSWVGRVSAAILQFNQPHMWKFELYEKLGFSPIGAICKTRLMTKFEQTRAKSEVRRPREYQMAEARRRTLKRTITGKNKAGSKLYSDKAAKYEKLQNILRSCSSGAEREVQFEVQCQIFDRELLEGVFGPSKRL